VWASNINYIRTLKGFCYLALITDMHPRKIVGNSLKLKGCVRALNEAIYQAKDIKGIIPIEEYNIEAMHTHKY
jgi:putative transposase